MLCGAPRAPRRSQLRIPLELIGGMWYAKDDFWKPQPKKEKDNMTKVTKQARNGGGHKLACAFAAVAAMVGVFAFGDTVVSDNIALSSTLTLDVPAGETWTYSGVISGSSGIVKNGGGTLCLTGANTFTGGVVVNEGTLDTSSATSSGWGTGTVTVNSTGTKVCRVVIRNSESAPLHFTGPTSDEYEGIYAEESSDGCSELKGAITADGNLYIKTFGSDTTAHMNSTRLKVQGTVTVASPGRLALAPHCYVDFTGLVTADILEGYWTANSATPDGGNPGGIRLNVYSNLITRILLDRTRLLTIRDYAIAGSIVEWTGLHPEGGTLDLAGYKIWVNGLVTPSGITQFAGTEYEKSFSVENGGNREISLRGVPANYGYVRFGSNVAVANQVKNVHFSNRSHELTKISMGQNLYFEGDTTFESPFTVTANNASRLYLQTTSPRALRNLTGFTLSSCTVNISADALASFPNDYTLDVSLGQNSHIAIPADGTLRVLRLYDSYAKQDLAAGAWTSANSPTDSSGSPRLVSGTFISATPVPGTESISWTGGAGADTSVGTPANWGLAPLPDFSKYGVSATVPTSDPILSFPAGDTLLTALSINPVRPADGGTATSVFAAEDATSRLLLQENGLSFASHGEHPCTYVYDFSVPTYLTGTSSLVFSSNDVVNVNGSLWGRGTLNIDLGGSHNNVKDYDPNAGTALETTGGILNLTGDNAYEGDVSVSNGIVNVSGTFGVPGEIGTFAVQGNYKVTSGSESWINYGCVVFTNATLNKKFYGNALGTGTAHKNATTWLQFAGTNVLNGDVDVYPSHVVVLRPGADVTFARGYTAENAFTLQPPTVSGTAARVTFTGPWTGLNSSKSHFNTVDAAGSMHVVFAGRGSYAARYIDLRGANNFFECTVDNAITAPYLYMRDNATLSITNCTVRIPCFYTSNANATLTGSDGGCFEITSGWSSDDVGSHLYRAKITGDLTLRMAGKEGYCQRLSGCVATSCGDVEVTGGTLQFDANSSWLVGTNVTVSGTGTLAINSSETFNKDFAVVHFADGGKIDVPSGVVQVFAEGWREGIKLAPGRYTASNLPAHVSGAGTIRIVGSGFMVIMR